MLCTTAVNTSNAIRTDWCRPNATPAVGILIRVIMCVTIAFNYRSLYDAIRYATATYTVDTAEYDDGFSGAQRQF